MSESNNDERFWNTLLYGIPMSNEEIKNHSLRIIIIFLIIISILILYKLWV